VQRVGLIMAAVPRVDRAAGAASLIRALMLKRPAAKKEAVSLGLEAARAGFCTA
jgi:hypothetical protein